MSLGEFPIGKWQVLYRHCAGEIIYWIFSLHREQLINPGTFTFRKEYGGGGDMQGVLIFKMGGDRRIPKILTNNNRYKEFY